MMHFPIEIHFLDGIGNFFQSSYKVDKKKEIPVVVEKNSLSHIFKKLEMVDIPGKPHIESYLRDQNRGNLGLTTIKNFLFAIVSFLFLVKQDRGSKPATVRNRLDNLKAVIRYQIRKMENIQQWLPHSKTQKARIPDRSGIRAF